MNLMTQKYKQHIQNCIKSSFYEQWQETGVFLPLKFRKQTQNMNEEQRETANKEGYKAMREEIEKMKASAKQAELKQEEIKTEMYTLIQRREMANVATQMIAIWNSEFEKKKTEN